MRGVIASLPAVKRLRADIEVHITITPQLYLLSSLWSAHPNEGGHAMPSVDLFQLCYRMYSALILVEPTYEVPLPVWYDASCQPAPMAPDLRVSIPSVNWGGCGV